MKLNEWLEQCHLKEQQKEASVNLEELFDHLDTGMLEKIASGSMSLDEALTKIAQGKEEGDTPESKVKEYSSGAMSAHTREGLKPSQFAIPESKAKKIGVAGEIKGEAEGKYPIPDEKHARNALARVSQHGTPAEREAVRSKVYAKYPQLRESFEERHGESPTSKENIKKKEQGGIEKDSESKVSAAKLGIMEKISRMMAREHMKQASCASRGMEKTDEFTTPEAKQKAQIMQTAMKSVKGAPPSIRKGAIKAVSKKI